MCARKQDTEADRWAGRYRAALLAHLAGSPKGSPRIAHELGREAVALGRGTLDLAKVHERTLATATLTGVPARTKAEMARRAIRFFAETIAPIEKTHPAAIAADIRAGHVTEAVRRRTAESAASTRRLKHSILHRRKAENVLRQSVKRHTVLRAELHRLRKQLSDLTRAGLALQENQRHRMSLHLHNEIAQSLIAIDLRLLTLRNAVGTRTESFKKEIADTQRLVRDSVKRMGQYAHDFDA